MSSLYSNNYTVVAANGQAPVDGPLLVNSSLVASAVFAQTPPQVAAAGAAVVNIAPSMCGAIIQIPAVTSASLTINLPIASQNPGFNCRFVMTAVAAVAVSIVTNPLTNAAMVASLVNNTGAAFTGLNSAVAGCRGVQFTTVAGVGDSIEVFTDGGKYIVKGYSNTNVAGLALVANV